MDPDGFRRIVWMINRMIKQGRQLDASNLAIPVLQRLVALLQSQ
jgi:hypothetical protein